MAKTPEDVLIEQLYNGLKRLGDRTNKHFQKNYTVPIVWITIAWPFGQQDRANRITNMSDEKEIARSLRELADRIEARGKIILPPKLP